MILSIGEILFDVFPDDRRIGGAPFNFAYHLKGLGFPVRFVSRVGDDEAGRELMSFLGRAGFQGRDVQIDPEQPTGTVEVELDGQGVPRFTILPQVAYDSLAFGDGVAELLRTPPRLIYFGSLIQRTSRGFAALHDILDNRHPDSRCLYDMNLRPGCFDAKIIDRSLQQADILKLNDEELVTAAEMFAVSSAGADAVRELMQRFDLAVIALTRGADGSELYVGRQRFEAAAPQPAEIADTVGAGDAYAAMLAAGILGQWPPQKILSTAARFSSRICAIEGAIPDDSAFYSEFVAEMKGRSNA